MEMKRWLVVDPAADEIKVYKQTPSLSRGQSAFPLLVRIPDSQRRIFTDKPITLIMRSWMPPEFKVGVGSAEYVEEAEMDRQQ